jgi:hypothetical protein
MTTMLTLTIWSEISAQYLQQQQHIKPNPADQICDFICDLNYKNICFKPRLGLARTTEMSSWFPQNLQHLPK